MAKHISCSFSFIFFIVLLGTFGKLTSSNQCSNQSGKLDGSCYDNDSCNQNCVEDGSSRIPHQCPYPSGTFRGYCWDYVSCNFSYVAEGKDQGWCKGFNIFIEACICWDYC